MGYTGVDVAKAALQVADSRASGRGALPTPRRALNASSTGCGAAGSRSLPA